MQWKSWELLEQSKRVWTSDKEERKCLNTFVNLNNCMVKAMVKTWKYLDWIIDSKEVEEEESNESELWSEYESESTPVTPIKRYDPRPKFIEN